MAVGVVVVLVLDDGEVGFGFAVEGEGDGGLAAKGGLVVDDFWEDAQEAGDAGFVGTAFFRGLDELAVDEFDASVFVEETEVYEAMIFIDSEASKL